MEWHSFSEKEVFEKLGSSEKGLNEKEASLRLKKYGPNQLKEIRKMRPFFIFLSQFASFLVCILLAAAIISAFLSHWLDFYVILGIVFLNSGIGFFQQYKAEKAIKKLRKMLVQKVKVLRGGKLRVIDSTHVVQGDVLLLGEGDKIAADARIFSCENLQTNEAILTGESMPVDKNAETLKNNIEVIDRTNMLYAGTSVVRGNCKAIVVATGMSTEFGKIAYLVQEVVAEKTPMQKKLDIFAKQLGIAIIILTTFITTTGMILGFSKLEMFFTAIALAVAAIPEGLPAIITICLALATKRMSKINALVRKLPAAETLGSTTVICVDKTGTITEEKMSVTQLYANKNFFLKEKNKIKKGKKEVSLEKEPELKQLFKISVLCNNARLEKIEARDGKIIKEYEIIGEPTESALVEAAFDLGIDKQQLTEAEPRIREFSFTSQRKMMSIVRQAEEKKKKISYVKGAPEIIIKNSSFELAKGKIVMLNEKRKNELLKIAEKFESNALRVLAFAFKNVKTEKITEKDAETNLVFVGFSGMLDPPRAEVKEAIKLCREAGISIKMITGDAALVAMAIAKEIGVKGKIVTGKELDGMNDEELKKEIDGITIFARTTPEHKLRIINILKEKNEVVAVTGDGVNDILALERADIGVAMGIRGADAARDASDIVLLDDNFATIVKAVEEGRRVKENTKKFICYLLGVNFAELLIIFYSILARLPLPLLPLQILWVNLVTDSAPALALGIEKSSDVLKKYPKDKGILSGMSKWIIFASLIAFLVVISIFYLTLNLGIEKARTITLTTLVLYELLFVFSCRSEKSLFKIGIFSNKWIIFAIILTIILQLAAIYTPLAIAFSLTPLVLADWLLILPFSLSGLIIFEIWKILKEKKIERF